MSTPDLDSIRRKLCGSHTLAELFGALPGERAEQLAELTTRWRSLAAACHPDRFDDPTVNAAATQVAAELNAAYRDARDAILHGTYDRGALLGADSLPVITTPTETYAVIEPLGAGELAELYIASDSSATRRVVKIARETADRDLMRREEAALRRLFAEDAPQHKHLLAHVDSFTTPDARRGHVLALARDSENLWELRERKSGALDPRHVIWIMRRCLSALGWAHHRGVVHANICPDHVLVRSKDHNIWLIDWCYSAIAPARTGQGFACLNPDFSPPEVAQRKPPLPASDLYALGKTMCWLLGAEPGGSPPEDTPEKLARFLRFMTLPSPLGRAQDAWRAYRQLERIRDELYGPHRFVPLDRDISKPN